MINKKSLDNLNPVKKGEVRNPSGLRKGTTITANNFKDWAFKYWKENQKEFETTILEDSTTAMNFLKMLSGFVPREVELGNKDGQPLGVKIIYPGEFKG